MEADGDTLRDGGPEERDLACLTAPDWQDSYRRCISYILTSEGSGGVRSFAQVALASYREAPEDGVSHGEREEEGGRRSSAEGAGSAWKCRPPSPEPGLIRAVCPPPA